ncbi:PhoH family protein [Helicobacter canis]|uniref:Phosphate starvation-inducible protein PhoH n=1 Tax=Helicobacter canis TaxID=29419 RepID=A0A5M9QMX2_9HELI|nr:PhoH family protein [Helicobacter canis]KAA8709591.1 phosphate starvation-inducible protein PhoH [Helicobacter canis]
MAKKSYLIDTSIILDDPENIIYLYDNAKNTLCISDVVLEELDKKKTSHEVGFLAREFFRNIGDFDKRATSSAKASKQELPFPPKEQDFLYIAYYESKQGAIPITIIYRASYKTKHLEYGLNDARIAEIAKDYGLTLLTNDIALKIRTKASGLNAQSLFRDRVENPSEINFWHSFLLHKDAPLAQLEKTKAFKTLKEWSLIHIDEQDNTDSSLYLTGKKRFGIKLQGRFEEWDLDTMIDEAAPYVTPINLDQKMLFCLLTHPHNVATIATGSTGSGKTLIALQAGLELLKQEVVDGIIYLRNTITANDKEAELGFRKGDEDQKLGYFMYPLYSAINFIIDSLRSSSLKSYLEYRGNVNTIHKEDATEYFLKKHNIQVVDIAHARGITIRKKFVIFDEVQNASNATIKLIGTRLGDDSRIVFLGDWAQIDHPYLSKFRNGAVSLLQKALATDIIAGIQLRQTIRSSIAQWFGESF